jgi:hypothetical protein
MPTFQQMWQDDLTTELGTNDTSVLFTDARRKHAINQGYRQFADLTECFVKRSSITVSSSAQEFNLNSSAVMAGSSGYLRMAGEGPAYITTDTAGHQQIAAGDDFPQRAIPYLDSADEGWRSTQTPGEPSGWYLREDGGRLLLGLDCPADVSTSETAELIVPFVANPSSMTSDTQMPFAESTNYRHDLYPYHQALVHYAAHQMEKLRRDDERAKAQMQLFMSYVQRYTQQHRKKGTNGVRSARSYFRNAMRRSQGEGGVLAPWWR